MTPATPPPPPKKLSPEGWVSGRGADPLGMEPHGQQDAAAGAVAERLQDDVDGAIEPIRKGVKPQVLCSVLLRRSTGRCHAAQIGALRRCNNGRAPPVDRIPPSAPGST
jgi:hypothetical protein